MQNIYSIAFILHDLRDDTHSIVSVHRVATDYSEADKWAKEQMNLPCPVFDAKYINYGIDEIRPIDKIHHCDENDKYEYRIDIWGHEKMN